MGAGRGEQEVQPRQRGDVAALAPGMVPGSESRTLPRPSSLFARGSIQLTASSSCLSSIASSRKESFERSHRLPELFHP